LLAVRRDQREAKFDFEWRTTTDTGAAVRPNWRVVALGEIDGYIEIGDSAVCRNVDVRVDVAPSMTP
jgi:hypothetical protein